MMIRDFMRISRGFDGGCIVVPDEVLATLGVRKVLGDPEDPEEGPQDPPYVYGFFPGVSESIFMDNYGNSPTNFLVLEDPDGMTDADKAFLVSLVLATAPCCVRRAVAVASPDAVADLVITICRLDQVSTPLRLGMTWPCHEIDLGKLHRLAYIAFNPKRVAGRVLAGSWLQRSR
jgi:hypothetical protein